METEQYSECIVRLLREGFDVLKEKSQRLVEDGGENVQRLTRPEREKDSALIRALTIFRFIISTIIGKDIERKPQFVIQTQIL